VNGAHDDVHADQGPGHQHQGNSKESRVFQERHRRLPAGLETANSEGEFAVFWVAETVSESASYDKIGL
jgi:hypothetical protein